jgi:hypothetical protein
MTKHKTIINFLTKIKNEINFNSILIVDYWEADLCAIGLRNNNKLIYISTYNYCNEITIKFDYICEIIDNEEAIMVVDKGVCISELEIFNTIRLFLEE